MSTQRSTIPDTAVPSSWGKPARWIRRLAVNAHGLNVVWLNLPRPIRVAASVALATAVTAFGAEPAVGAVTRILGQ